VGLTIDINVVDDMRGNTAYTRESYNEIKRTRMTFVYSFLLG